MIEEWMSYFWENFITFRLYVIPQNMLHIILLNCTNKMLGTIIFRSEKSTYLHFGIWVKCINRNNQNDFRYNWNYLVPKKYFENDYSWKVIKWAIFHKLLYRMNTGWYKIFHSNINYDTNCIEKSSDFGMLY